MQDGEYSVAFPVFVLLVLDDLKLKSLSHYGLIGLQDMTDVCNLRQ